MPTNYFIGEEEYRVDKKGRVTFPPEFRPAVEEFVYLRQSEEEKLFYLYSREDPPFEKAKNGSLEEVLKSANMWRHLSLKKLDSAGRISLGEKVASSLGEDNRVFFIGAGKMALLYLGSKEAYDVFSKQKIMD